MEKFYKDEVRYTSSTQTSQRDPRDLNVLTEDEYNRAVRDAEEKAERAAVAAMTPAQQMNHRLKQVAAKYGEYGVIYSWPV